MEPASICHAGNNDLIEGDGGRHTACSTWGPLEYGRMGEGRSHVSPLKRKLLGSGAVASEFPAQDVTQSRCPWPHAHMNDAEVSVGSAGGVANLPEEGRPPGASASRWNLCQEGCRALIGGEEGSINHSQKSNVAIQFWEEK